ncbi:sensor protein, partial [Azospirillum brasilense]|nr:sensor protein [Azospirillum brasilense]
SRCAHRGHGRVEAWGARLVCPFCPPKPGGMGLGLAIRLTSGESHGGHLWATDHPGGGTVVRFVLPAAEEKVDAG